MAVDSYSIVNSMLLRCSINFFSLSVVVSMDPAHEAQLAEHLEMLLVSLSVNAGSFNSILDSFKAARILPDEEYEERLIEFHHTPRQIKGSIRRFIGWMRNSADDRCFDHFCLALKKVGMDAVLKVLRSGTERDCTVPDGDIPAVSRFQEEEFLIYVYTSMAYLYVDISTPV